MRKIYFLPFALLPGVLVAPAGYAQTAPSGVAAPAPITGVVRQATDRTPLPGVNVVVKGTSTGTSTNADGRYSLAGVPAGATLVFSFVGYEPVERRADGGPLDIALTASNRDLDEVVVLGYGIKQERRDLVTAVQEVSSKDIIDSRQPNVVNALQGKVAGVNITSSGGGAGEGASIVIRGGTSLDGDNQPLFVIDGMIMDNSSFQESSAPGGGSAFNGLLGRSVGAANRAGDLNPEDIASMTVLKGPAAAALYGLRAANGAVVITTKKGTAGRTQLNFRSQFSVDEVNRLPKMQDQYAQGSNGVFDATTRMSFGPRFQPGQPVYDNIGNFFQKGYSYQNFLNMSGGSEKASFFASASNLRQTGVTPQSNYDKTTVRLSGSAQISPKLSVTGSGQYLNSGARRLIQGPGLLGTAGSSSGGFLLSLLNWPRNDDASNYLNPDGSRRRLLPLGSGIDADADNPYWTADKNPQTDRTNRFIGNVQLSFSPTKWLTLSHNIGTDWATSRNTSVRAVGTSQVSNQNGGIAETVDQNRVTTATTLATFTHNFGEKLRGSFILGNTIEENRDEAVDYLGLVFKNPNFIGLNNTVTTGALQRDSKRHLIGNFARLSTTLFDQLIVELQGRYDQSSTLPRPDEGKVFGKGFFYGSAAAGYEFTKVLGLDQSPILSYGKLRASVAEVGRDTGPYRVESPLTSNTYIGGGFRNDFYGSNPLLKPERTRTYEAGVALQFFKNRLSLDFNYYRSRTIDQLIAPRVSQATGFILQYINGGVVTNEGQEISLSGTPVRTSSGFSWDVLANFYHNTNNVESLPSPLTVVYQSDTFITNVHEGGAFPGHPISGIAATDFARVNDPNSPYNGQVIVNATTGYPTVNPNFVYAGNRAPRFTTQLTNTFTYKGLSLTTLFDFRVGGVVVNGNDYYQTTVAGTSNRTTERYKTVVFDGVVATRDANGNTTYAPNTRPAELAQNYYTTVLSNVGTPFIEDGSWARLRYLTLSYALPARWLGGSGSYLKGVELNVTGRNLVLLTKYSGTDPETAASGAGVRGGGSGGIDYGNIPATRGVDMGLRVNF